MLWFDVCRGRSAGVLRGGQRCSRHKLTILSKYLQPLTYKIGSRWPQLWIVDGFAGAGEYKPDAAGVAQPGSPLIAAKWARDLERTRGRQVLRCINVESHPKVYETLRANLAPWKELVDFRFGEFAEHLDGTEGTFEMLWEEHRRDDRVSALRDDIHRLGLQRGTATPQELRHQLVADRFGQFTITDYNKAVRTLVAEERIDRPTAKGIKDDERLLFVSPPQQFMFG
jgi:hypothetical protein